MKLSAPVSSIFLLQRAAPTGTILMKPASSSPGVGLNQHQLWTSACRTLPKTGQKIPCQKSQVAKPNKEGAHSKPVRTIGQAALVVPEAIETERAATPARVGLNQHIQRLSHLAMPVLAVTNKADVHRTLAAGKRRAASRPKPNNFGAEGASTRNPGPTPLPDESGKRLFYRVDWPPTVIVIHAMQPERPLEPRKTCDHRFRPAQVRSATSPGMLQTTSPRPLKPEPATAPVFTSLKPVAFREAEN